jgi:hypothetical protein
MLNKIFQSLLSLGCLMGVTACVNPYVTWKEEVQLNDGRIIVVEQKKRCEGASTGGGYASCIAREAWLTIDLPEFSAQPIVWHEHLLPMILNIYNGRLYVVGDPPGSREFYLYGGGKEHHPYFGFVWDNGKWKQIPFKEIPESIYSANLILGHIPSSGLTFLSIEKKMSNEMQGAKSARRIDPTILIDSY